MNDVLLIASAAYVDAELEAELGRLPPSFLPVGNRRLFQHQREMAHAHFRRVILSVPDDFTPDREDGELLNGLGIEVVPVPQTLSLGESIVYVINVTATAGGNLAILHGDTLISDLDLNTADSVAVSEPAAGYRWGELRNISHLLNAEVVPGEASPPTKPEVLSGYFSFTNAGLLVQSVTRAGGDFVEGLHRYAQVAPLKAQQVKRWLDFGHVNTFHRSRQRMTTERAFNQLKVSRHVVTKSSQNSGKIAAEAQWFEALPPALRLYTPAYLGTARQGEADQSYSIEYMHLPTLSDLFVFGRLPGFTWNAIFSACSDFLTACSRVPAPPDARIRSEGLLLSKTLERLESYARADGVSLDMPSRFNGAWLPSLRGIAEIAAGAIGAVQDRHLTLVHGDFCFSNILFDSRAGLVRVIDPRGTDATGQPYVHGDLRYDIGKLYHSVIGRYDYIVAGYRRVIRHSGLDYELDLPAGNGLKAIEAAFLEAQFAGMTAAEASAPAIAVLLFLSMLPLHADDPERQCALLANALRLFQKLDTSDSCRRTFL